MPIRSLRALSTLGAALLLSACAAPGGGHWHWHPYAPDEPAVLPGGGHAMAGPHHGGMACGAMGGPAPGGPGMMGPQGHDHHGMPGGPGMMGRHGHDHGGMPGGPGMMDGHRHDHGPGAGGMPPGGPGMMGRHDHDHERPGMAPGGRDRGDMMGPGMSRMCEMLREMTAGKSPAEQQAAIEAHIRRMHGTVTPEMVAQHRRMMESRCPPGADAPAR